MTSITGTGSAELVVRASSDIAPRRLESMPEVEAVHSYDGTPRVPVDERHTTRVNQTLVEADVAVTELRRGDGQLEDVFLEITDESLPGPTAHELTQELSCV